MSYREVFEGIYENYGFGGKESRSGPGSTLEETSFLRKRLVELIESRGIKSLVDIPCGDFNWMKEIVSGIDSYFGGDIVEKCVTDNNEKYATDKIRFELFDLAVDDIPKGDLLLVRDVIGHVPLTTGKKIVENILRSDCKYVLTTSWYNELGNKKVLPKNREVDPGRFYPVNLFAKPFGFPPPEELIVENVRVEGFEEGNRKALLLWDISKLREHFREPIIHTPFKKVSEDTNLTIVSGLWDLGRPGRDFEEHYLPRFKEFLRIPHPMILFLPENLHAVVKEIREDYNTRIISYELEDIKRMYSPHWDKTQKIRTSDKWLNITGEGGWLKNSPQATLEYYNPIVQSKMFLLHDASIFNNFNTDYFVWLDAGITNTVPASHLIEDDCLSKIIDHIDPFLFLSYPYESAGEIHGFDFEAMNRIAGERVKYVCRGGLFGGRKEQISRANSMYYGLLESTLSQGYMGTEESIFTLMSYISPHEYRRYALDDNGLIVKFTEALLKNTVKLEDEPTNISKPLRLVSNSDVEKVKTSLYVLTFNFPEQLKHLIDSLDSNTGFLEKSRLILFDNSTDKKAKKKNKKIAEEYGFEYHGFDNIGITGGRQKVAEHFHESDSDYMFFFEDDMTLNGPEETGVYCRNGFRKYIPDLYTMTHKIIMRGEYDFVKLSFTEVFMDNQIQCSWYNVPQEVRKRVWPNYHKLPVAGLDANCPRTKFNNIEVLDGVSYIDGEIYYCNWPMIVSKAGNQKMFIDTKFASPHESTIMSYNFQETLAGNIRPAVLLASPISHERLHHYKSEERKEC